MIYIFNILWFIFVGWWNTLSLLVLSGIFTITIIGYPIGKALFQFAILNAAPFGKEIIRESELVGSENISGIRKLGGLIANLIWLPIGLTYTILYLIAGIIAMITIIGIPVGIVYMRMGKFLLFPIGAVVVDKE